MIATACDGTMRNTSARLIHWTKEPISVYIIFKYYVVRMSCTYVVVKTHPRMRSEGLKIRRRLPIYEYIIMYILEPWWWGGSCRFSRSRVLLSLSYNILYILELRVGGIRAKPLPHYRRKSISCSREPEHAAKLGAIRKYVRMRWVSGGQKARLFGDIIKLLL